MAGTYTGWGMGNAGTPQAAGGPGAGRSEIVGRYGDAWKVRIGPPRSAAGRTQSCSTCSLNASASDGRSSPSSRGSPRETRSSSCAACPRRRRTGWRAEAPVAADEARARLLEERVRVVAALDYLHEENAGSLHEEAEEATIADNIGETATERSTGRSTTRSRKPRITCSRRSTPRSNGSTREPTAPA